MLRGYLERAFKHLTDKFTVASIALDKARFAAEEEARLLLKDAKLTDYSVALTARKWELERVLDLPFGYKLKDRIWNLLRHPRSIGLHWEMFKTDAQIAINVEKQNCILERRGLPTKYRDMVYHGVVRNLID